MPGKRALARKPHEKRVDLQPYRRLFRFLRWMHSEVSGADALHMLPESEGWMEDVF
jgi:hypothetical protein